MESSRIIVKNLPKYTTEDQLKQRFSEKGLITDVKLVKTADGVSRRFAYIGFKTGKEAKATVKHFHNTFVDTAKITVEIARPIGDASLPRAWSKYTKGTSAYNQRHGIKPDDAKSSGGAAGSKQSGKDGVGSAAAEDANTSGKGPTTAAAAAEGKKSFIDELYLEQEKRKSLQTYLEVLRPRGGKQRWANDDASSENVAKATDAAAASKKNKGNKKDKDVNVVVQAVANRKPGGEGMMIARSHVTFGDDEGDSDEEYQAMPAKEAQDEVNEDQEDEEEDGDESGEEESESSAEARPDDEDADEPNEAEEDDPTKSPDSAIAGEGDAAAAASGTHPSKTVVPLSAEDVAADEAQIAETSRLYVVNLPYSCTEDDVVQLFSKHGAVGAVHMPVRRDTKQPKGIAFVTMVQPADALAAYRALRDRIFQGRVLTVRGAQAEQQKKAEGGGDAADGSSSAFKAKRLAQLKAKAGSDFNWNSLYMGADSVADAMASRLGVAKSQILDRDADDMAVRLALAETHVVQDTKQYLAQHGVCLDAFQRKLRSDSVLLVKNIAHGSQLAEIEAAFSSFGEMGRILVPPAGTVAVVEFLAKNDAKAAFRHMAYKKFKGLPLYLEWAPKDCFEVPYDPAKHRRGAAGQQDVKADGEEVAAPTGKRGAKGKGKGAEFLGDENMSKKPDAPIAGADDAANTKLMVRNVPFEATAKDLRQLFASFAHVKSVRVPKKVTGGHRGFAFAEFLTHSEALAAAQALRHTHLYGRRLVIEFAKAHESVDELRERTKLASGENRLKRQKVDMAGKYVERAASDDEDDDE